MKTNAVLFTGVNCVEFGAVELPDPGRGQVLVEASYSCISPGTDLRVLAGKEPAAESWPLVPGYSMVGRVIALGEAVEGVQLGQRVFCTGTELCSHNRSWGGHMGHAIVSAGKLYPIPASVDDLHASIAKLAAIAYHGSTRTQPKSTDTVAVVGLGPIGMLAAICHRLSGARVVATDLYDSRLELAKQFGIEVVPTEASLRESFTKVLPRGADIVVDSTGSPKVLDQCMDLTRELPWDGAWDFGSKLLIQGSYAETFTLDYRKAFVRELRVLLTRDQQAQDLLKILELMDSGKINLSPIISDVLPASKAASAFQKLREGDKSLMTLALKWS